MHNCCRAAGWVAVARRASASPADPGQLESATSTATGSLTPGEEAASTGLYRDDLEAN